MLILQRKIGEDIVINNDIIVKIIGIGRGFARVGVQCDKSIPVHRKEIQDKINSENNEE